VNSAPEKQLSNMLWISIDAQHRDSASETVFIIFVAVVGKNQLFVGNYSDKIICRVSNGISQVSDFACCAQK